MFYIQYPICEFLVGFGDPKKWGGEFGFLSAIFQSVMVLTAPLCNIVHTLGVSVIKGKWLCQKQEQQLKPCTVDL